MLLTLIFLCLLSGCNTPESKETNHWKAFEGRLENLPIYQAKVPDDWVLQPLEGKKYLIDTRLPIASFSVDEVLITIHNFPTLNIEERIAPALQVQRWQRQFDSIDPISLTINNHAYGGFWGLSFEASGLIKGEKKSMLAYAMQLAKEHYYALSSDPVKEPKFRQMRADYTIKAVGPPEKLELRKAKIRAFAESFELIDEI